ncbi:lipid-binding SYLF domain-containing protein [Oecophyllibacter saccharovorans]|uniref:lipid-binding SYLF domain-containing protein n=1 Tax=Oecophyllibacter saccharovorans TaxID=2558360 RepID=UPI001E5E6214|nr:lipid-binding SYLF domain-containing protein [Oecophyllibacter saccharovorans]
MITAALSVLATGVLATSVQAAGTKTANTSKEQLLIEQATTTVQNIFNGSQASSRPQKILTRARAVLICPSIIRMSFVFGGSGGRCLLLSRDARGSWSDPAFYHLSGGSFGLQLGYQDAQVMFFIMTQHGLQALLDHQFKFDANAGVSFTNLGANAESSRTPEKGSDIYALQKANGVFAGAALGGTKLTSDSAADRAYYHQVVGPEDIVINMRVNNPAADPLRRILMKAAPAPKLPVTAPANSDTHP